MSARPPGDASPPFSGRGRSRSGNEDGLRALGTKIDGRGATGPVPNESGLRDLGDRVERERGTKGHRPGGFRSWSTRRKILVPLAALAVLALLVVAAGYGYIRYRYDQIQKVAIASEVAAASGGPINILVIGSDSRGGLPAATFGSVTTVSGQRSDVDIVLHVVPQTKQVTVLSIPRDTLVQMVGPNVDTFGRFNRINSSFNSGANLTVETIEANFGIPINHVIQVNFAGFEGAVNALGGVSMNFANPARDAWSDLDVTSPGCQLLDGKQALAVARSRHYQYYATGEWRTDPSGDYGRIKRQDAFLRALLNAAKSKYNPLTINAFLGSIPQGITIDDKLSLGELVGLALDLHSVNATAIDTLTLPTQSIGDVSPWGDVLFVDQPAAQQMLVSIFGSELTAPTAPPPDTALVPSPPPVVAGGPGAGTSSGTSGTGVASASPGAPAAAAPSTTTTTTAPPPYDPTACAPS